MSRLTLFAALALAALGCGRTFSRPSTAQLSVQVEQPAVAPTGTTVIDVSGGQPPYSFSFTEHGKNSGSDAEVDASGHYRAGSSGSAVDQLRIADQSGAGAFVTITVGPRLQLTPGSASVAPGGAVDFTASGGQAPYVFSLSGACAGADGGGSTLALDGATAHYRAGTACGSTYDELAVVDSLGVRAGPARVDLGPRLAVQPDGAQLAPGQSLTLQAVGGLPPYSFRYAPHGNLSAGSLDPSGVYHAGTNPDVADRVQVVDGAGTVAEASVGVGDAEFDLPPQGDYQLHRANLNGDGFADLLAISTSGVNLVQVFLGSSGGLIAGQVLVFGGAIRSSTVADFDGDGLDDLVLEVEEQPERYVLLRGQPDGTLSVAAQLDEADLGLQRAPAVFDGPEGRLLAFLSMPTGVLGDAQLLLVQVADGGAAFPGESGGLPLRAAGALPLGHPVCPWEVFLGGAAGGLAYYDGSTDGGTCNETGGEGALHFVSGFDPVADDGGLSPRGDASLAATLCPACVDPFLHGGAALGAAEFTQGEPSLYLAQSSPLGPGRVSWAPLSNGVPGALQEQALPPSSWIDVVPPVSTDAGNPLWISARLDAVGTAAGSELFLQSGAFAAAGAALPAGLSSSSVAPFTGSLLPDLAAVDANGRVTLRLASVVGSYGVGNHFGYLGEAGPSTSTDLDGDGRADLLLAARSLYLFGGAPGGLATDARLLEGQRVTALAPGRAGEAWAVVAGTQASSLAQLAPGDGGPVVQLFALPDGVPTTAVQAVALPDGGLQLVLADSTTDGTRWTALELRGDQVAPLGQGQLAGGTFSSAEVDPSGASVSALVTSSDGNDVFRYLAEPDGGYAQKPGFSSADISGACSWGYSFAGAAMVVPSKVGGAPDLLVGSADATFCEYVFEYYAFAGSVQSHDFKPVSGPLLVPRAVVPADLDGDGNTDVLVDGFDLDNHFALEIAWGDGAGHFTMTPVALTDQALSQFAAVLPGDFDGDGHPDLAFVLDTGVITVLHGDGARKFH